MNQKLLYVYINELWMSDRYNERKVGMYIRSYLCESLTNHF